MWKNNMFKYFAGIGSRDTPVNVLQVMPGITVHCATKRFYLRSGGAKGADLAFSQGVIQGDPTQIFTAHEATSKSIDYVRDYYSKEQFDGKPRYVQRLLGRNAMIILGPKLDTPSRFVVCWTPGGKVVGGTGLGIKIANKHKIPVYNLADPATYRRVRNALGVHI